ncbi:glutamate racemase [bacterium SCSIO 12741]|nr:glutamate racemase [bacterium SCSIO 12741]
MSKTGSIGIFDSGVGGLTVARAIKSLLPNEKLIYFGDTLHLPYGDKSPESITRYSLAISDFLIQKECKVIVIACNSASASAYHPIREKYGDQLPIINVIAPMVDYVREHFSGEPVGVIGTKATVKSKVYQDQLRDFASCQALMTPLLAPLIEEGFAGSEISEQAIKHYLSQPDLEGIKALILGCTHYPLLVDEIKTYYQGKTEVLDSSHMVASALQKMLEEHDLSADGKNAAKDEFYVSDHTLAFQEITRLFFGEEIQLKLEKLS